MSNHNSSFGLSLAPAIGTTGNWQRRLAATAAGGGWWRLVGLARSFCKARALLCALLTLFGMRQGIFTPS